MSVHTPVCTIIGFYMSKHAHRGCARVWTLTYFVHKVCAHIFLHYVTLCTYTSVLGVYLSTYRSVDKEGAPAHTRLHMPFSRPSTVPSIRFRPPHRIPPGTSTMCKTCVSGKCRLLFLGLPFLKSLILLFCQLSDVFSSSCISYTPYVSCIMDIVCDSRSQESVEMGT